MPATPILSPVPPLRIAVLGAGKIGSAFAFHLARTGGHDVTVVARPDSVRLQQLKRDRAIVDVKGARADVRVASRLDEAVPYDLVIVTLLAHQADALLPALRSSAAEGIQFMFNTFDPERLSEALGDDRCSFGMPFVQATLTADGRLDAKVGAAGQRTIMGRQRWVEPVQRGRTARGTGTRHAVLAALPRSAVRGLRKRVDRRRAARERCVLEASPHPGARFARELRARPGARVRDLPEDEEAHPTQSYMGGGGYALVALARSTLPEAAGDGRSRMPLPGRGYGDGGAAREVAGRRRGCSGYGAGRLTRARSEAPSSASQRRARPSTGYTGKA